MALLSKAFGTDKKVAGLNIEAQKEPVGLDKLRQDVANIRDFQKAPIQRGQSSLLAETGLEAARKSALGDISKQVAGQATREREQIAQQGGLSAGASERAQRRAGEQGAVEQARTSGVFAGQIGDAITSDIFGQEQAKRQALFKLPELANIPVGLTSNIDRFNVAQRNAGERGRFLAESNALAQKKAAAAGLFGLAGAGIGGLAGGPAGAAVGAGAGQSAGGLFV